MKLPGKMKTVEFQSVLVLYIETQRETETDRQIDREKLPHVIN